MGDQGGPDGLRGAGFDAGVGLRDQLAEAIASLRWQTALMLSHTPGRVSGAEVAAPEGESSRRSDAELLGGRWRP
ncbi:hypothetical protein [Streptomyces sp. NBC_00576]|uniref:hypothetical protein n=1 Tax=Streptomyces sp. NBC_00576 TaxID=2903665 RepID=UPI002E8038E0|nr:hypothetical protein [Streptomyces sp. NBC_00576]WUB68773.1 hypothetical protein OG734_00925 [Streptomyces sp. NBC_00576]